MDNKTTSQLRQLDKEELIKQNLSLRNENETLFALLQARKEKFKLIGDSLQAAIFMLNDDGKIIYSNPFTAKLTGYTNEELLNFSSLKLIHPDFQDLEKQRHQARLRGEPTKNQYEIRLLSKTNQTMWVDIHLETFETHKRTIILGTAIDITKRKQKEDDLRRNEEALRQNEEKFKAFTDNLQAMVYAYDSKGNFTYLNKKCEEFTGYTEDELLGKNFTTLFNSEYKNIATKRTNLRRENRLINTFYDYQGVKKDGSRRWWELSEISLKNENDEITVLGSAFDITERVESKKALEESEEKFRALFERSSDAMLLLDKNGFFDCNQASIKLSKANSKSDIITHPSSLSPEFQADGQRSNDKSKLMIEKAYDKGFHRFEWLHQDFQGNTFWSDVSLTVIPYKNRKIIFTIWRDISTFKELEQLLRDEREQLLVTLRSIGDAVITTDLDGRIVLINRVAERLTGWKQAEACGQEIDKILKLINGQTGEPARNPLDRAITQGTILELEDNTILISRNGQKFKVADSASPIRNNKSEIIGGILVFRDVTDRELMQEEVFKLRKLESVGRLAGGIAHDFNNLLTGIMGNIEVANLRLGPNEIKVRENLDKAMKASLRAAGLTQRLLTFAKGGEPVREAADLEEIIKESAEFPLLGSKISLELNIPENLWVAEVDSGQISQVIQNLVINAVQSMPDGGTISIDCKNISADIAKNENLLLKPAPYIKISVRDQGCGIDDELKEKIFDPFFTTKNEGSGLGLSVIHSIIKKHDGHVHVDSELGIFSEFTIFLPAMEVVSSHQENVKGDIKAPPASSGRILIMDDEMLVRETLSEILTTAGYTVACVTDGKQALELYKQQKFDIVIMDLTIPGGIGGYKAIKMLKEIDPQAKAIVSSGYSNDPIVTDYKNYGFCGFLNKPYIIEELLKLLKKTLTDQLSDLD